MFELNNIETLCLVIAVLVGWLALMYWWVNELQKRHDIMMKSMCKLIDQHNGFIKKYSDDSVQYNKDMNAIKNFAQVVESILTSSKKETKDE